VRRDGLLGVRAEIVNERGQPRAFDQESIVTEAGNEGVAGPHRDHGNAVSVAR